MTTIRISRLPEIQNDRVSSDDFLIINDGDIVTSKVRFEEFVYAIGAQDIEFTGDISYTGDVVFEGDVTGDFYNKDEVYTKAEIDQLITNLSDYNVVQDARITAIETLIGRPSLSTDLGIFPGNVIPDNATIVDALDAIEHYIMDNRLQIEQHEIEIIALKNRVDALEIAVDNINTIINGNGSGGGGGTNPPDSGITDQINWLIQQVENHEIRIEALEILIQEHEVKIEDLRDDVDDLIKKGKINDAENANLITLSGVGKNGGTVEGAAIVSDNLENFTYPVVPHAVFNEILASPALDGKNVKQAFQIQLEGIRTRAPIQAPVFTELSTGQKYGITGPRVAPSMIPMYHSDITSLRGYKHAQDDTQASCEGAFAYTRSNTGYTGGTDSNSNATQGRAWFRNQTDWIELLATGNPGAIWEALGLKVAQNDAAATALGVKSGYVYIQKQNANDPDEDGLLKVNGINTGSNPRA